MSAPSNRPWRNGKHLRYRDLWPVREARRRRLGTALWLLLTGLACSGVPSLPELEAPEGAFSTGLAAAHFDRLQGIGARWPGSRADALARAYLRQALEGAGAEVTSLASVSGRVHMLASLPGDSRDRVLVIVPYALLGPSDVIDDSGSAIALELVRTLATRPRPYSSEVVFADVRPLANGTAGDAALEGDAGEPGGWVPVETDAAARARLVESGRDLLDALRSADRLEGTRAVIVIEPHASDRARVARDLRSHPVLRGIFWDVAARLDLRELFPETSTWTSPSGLQDALLESGFGHVLTLADEMRSDPARPMRSAVPESPGPTTAWTGIGVVTDQGLGRLMHRFGRVDAFAPPRDPLP